MKPEKHVKVSVARWVLAMVAICSVVISVLYYISSPVLAVQNSPAGHRKFKIFKRKASFEVANSLNPNDPVPLVSGKGGLPIRLKITDAGRSPKSRRLQVIVAVYLQRQPNTVKVGERFLVQTNPKILETGPNEDGSSPFEWDIPMLPGDYVAHVFLCDPDQPYVPGGILEPHAPDAEDVPGSIKHAQAIKVHIDPE